MLYFCHVYSLQTPDDAPWTESPDVKVDDSNVLGYTALTRLEDWASNIAPLMGIEFDQVTLFSGSAYTYHLIHSFHLLNTPDGSKHICSTIR